MYLRTVKTVLVNPLYTGLFLGLSFFVMSFAIFLPHVRLLKTLLEHESVSLIEIGSLVLNLYGSLVTNFTFLSASSMVVIALLFGLQVTFLVYYIRIAQNKAKNVSGIGASSLGGLVSGLFGIGCATCGTFLISSSFILLGTGSLLAWLPLGGEEFGLAGVGLLLYANHVVVKKVNTPMVCSV